MLLPGSANTGRPEGSSVTKTIRLRGALMAGLPSPGKIQSVQMSVEMMDWAGRTTDIATIETSVKTHFTLVTSLCFSYILTEKSLAIQLSGLPLTRVPGSVSVKSFL